MEIDAEDRPEHFHMLRIEGPESLSIEKIEMGALRPDRPEDIAHTQGIGEGGSLRAGRFFWRLPACWCRRLGMCW